MGVSRELLRQRNVRFTQFLHTQELSFLPIANEFSNSMRQKLLVFTQDREEIAKVTLSYTQCMYLTAKKGLLKTRLLAWNTQEERYRIKDVSDPEDLEHLESYRVLLPPHTYVPLSSEGIPTASPAIRLTSADSPLVDLAERLGYSVSITASNVSSFSPHYVIMNASAPSSVVAQGDHLVRVLAEMLSPQHAHD